MPPIQQPEMTALMMTAIRELELVEVPVPAPEQPGEVLLRVRAAGVCGSDLHGYVGTTGRRTPPLIMGHEVTGEVVTTGEGVTDLPVGTRVAVQPVAYCGACAQCRAGYPNLCTHRRLMGMNAPGGYAPYVVWPAENLYPLPDGLSFEQGALAEPLAVAVHAVGLAEYRPDDVVLVVGAGPIGLLILMLLKHAGLSRLAISDLSDERLALARELGAAMTINPAQQPVEEAIGQFTDGDGVDVAFEAVGLSATVGQAIGATRNGGTVVWVGNNARVVEVDMQSVVTRELTIRGSYGMRDDDFRRALALLAESKLPAARLITRRASLAEGPELFEELLSDPAITKCVITFW